MENTIIRNLTFTKSENDSNEFYHAQEGISPSGVKLTKQSPAHYKEEKDNPSSQTDAMFFGSAYHTFILENDRFYQEYKIIDLSKRPEIDKTMGSKKNITWLADLKESGPCITTQTHEQLKGMRSVLFRHPFAKSLLTGGEIEHSYYCELDIGAEKPIKFRFRPDNVKHKKRIVIDLKTTKNASKDGFPKECVTYEYQIQSALYADLMELVMEEELGYEFFFVAQEKVAPYAFNIFQASPQFRSIGKYEYEILLMLYAWCLEQDRWPGYQIFCQNRYGVNELNMPPWSIKELEYFTHKL